MAYKIKTSKKAFRGKADIVLKPDNSVWVGTYKHKDFKTKKEALSYALKIAKKQKRPLWDSMYSKYL